MVHGCGRASSAPLREHGQREKTINDLHFAAIACFVAAACYAAAVAGTVMGTPVSVRFARATGLVGNVVVVLVLGFTFLSVATTLQDLKETFAEVSTSFTP